MRCLITGGAGFIGSHVSLSLIEYGHDVTIIDNLSTGHKAAIPPGANFHQIDLLDTPALSRIFSNAKWDAVFHLASLSIVGNSIKQPYQYLRHNILTSLNLIETCALHDIPYFVFSSTAALFKEDNPHSLITNTTPVAPQSPYGDSKFLVERALYWADRIHNMRSCCLRYFNAAGADPKGRLGEDHRPETHLIPLAIDAALGRIPALKIFGHDYPTPDGTCVRDYIHVQDLADAHIRALNHLNNKSVSYNLGTGQGFSNLEVIQAVELVTGKSVPWSWGPRRAGDPASLVTDSSLIRKELNWKPRFTKLEQIIETAYRWRVENPNGYPSL